MARVLVVLLLAAALAGVAEAKPAITKNKKCNPKSNTACCRDKKKTCQLKVVKKPEKCGLKAFRSKCRESCNTMWAGEVANIWEEAICNGEYKDSMYCPMKGPFCTATCQKKNKDVPKNSWWYKRASPISKGSCMKNAPATVDTPKRYPGVGKYKNPFVPSDVSCVCDTFEDGIKLKDVPKLSRTTGFCQKKLPEYDGLGKAIKRCRTMHVGLSDGERTLCAGDYEYCTYNLSPPPPSPSPPDTTTEPAVTEAPATTDDTAN